jgi:BolA protein
MNTSDALVPSAAALEEALVSALQPSVLEVIDESAAHAGHAGANGLGRGTHFRVRIACASFHGKSRVAQHRLVYDALRKFTDAGLHALAIEIAH